MLKFQQAAVATNQARDDDASNKSSQNDQSETNSSQGKKQAIEVDYLSILDELKKDGHKLRADRNQPNLAVKPAWFDESLYENAKSVYKRHFMGINFSHLSGLLLLVRVTSIYKTLSATGKSDSVAQLFKRYYHTVIHVKKWYEGDIFDETSDAYQSLLIVRGMHSKVSSNLNDCKTDQTGDDSSDSCFQKVKPMDDLTKSASVQQIPEMVAKHISEYDLMITQFAFVGLIVTKAKNVGLLDDFSQRDLESLLHFWRVIGYYLGATNRFNLCSRNLDDIIGLCKAIMVMEYRSSLVANPIDSLPGIMSVNIVRSVKFIPMLTIFGIMKYLYEILEVDLNEIADKETRYSHISYTLIKLVMTRLLAYKAFRSFNNGLTRLSVHLVGKVEDWFANRLESKYGHELKL